MGQEEGETGRSKVPLKSFRSPIICLAILSAKRKYRSNRKHEDWPHDPPDWPGQNQTIHDGTISRQIRLHATSPLPHR